MDAESRSRLCRNLKGADEDSLVALANRGLVRRAIKDLAQVDELVVEETAEAVLVQGRGWTVRMPADGPAAATDDTPATGVTRQILLATMYLRDHWCEAVPMESDSNDVSTTDANAAVEAAVALLVDAPLAHLAKWAGKTPLLEASAMTDDVDDAVIAHAPHLAVDFARQGVRVVLMSDDPPTRLRSLLDQFRTTANRDQHARWVLLAVLVLRRAAGKDMAVDPDPGLALTDAIRDDRRRIARKAQHLLRAVTAAGIAHPSSRIAERLRTAAVGAEAARFPRLSRLLGSIADDARLQLARDAGADLHRMMRRMVVAHALAGAGTREENVGRAELFGRSRSTYSPAGDLQLHGVGAYGWRTASGYEGLTTLFWDASDGRFLTASISRGEGQDRTFSIPYAYDASLGWPGSGPIAEICRSQVTLTRAKTNVEGRLSQTAGCSASMGDPTDPQGIDFGEADIRAWRDLVPIAQQSQPIGIRLPDPRASYVVIRPAKWGERWFDELEQAFVWELYDGAGAPLQARVPWSQVDEQSVAFLEALHVARDRPVAILGRLQVAADTLCVYPFSVFSQGATRGDKVLCPQFDRERIRSRNDALLGRLRKKFKRQPVVDTRIGNAEVDEALGAMPDTLTTASPLLQHIVADMDNVVTAALESGSTSLHPTAQQTLLQCRDRLQELGVTRLADAASEVIDPGGPTALLRVAYLLLLFRQSLHLAQFA